MNAGLSVAAVLAPAGVVTLLCIAARNEHTLLLARFKRSVDAAADHAGFSPRKTEAVRWMIAQGLVSVAFQPIWDMRSARPLGFEVLARPSAELCLSGPQEAFDIAERIGLLPELDALCMRRALDSAAQLPAGSVVFVNYSPASLADPVFEPQRFVETTRAAGFLPGQIVIELTERRVDQPAILAGRVTALRELGVRVSLDDSLSGHAGLAILSKVRFDFIKIDRALVIDAMRTREARGVLRGLIAVARETKSYVIAEGIETAEMLDFIVDGYGPTNGDAGVRGLQGYVLGKPEKSGYADLGSLEDHHAFLAARRPRRVTAAWAAGPARLPSAGTVRS